MIKVQDLVKRYGNNVALDHISFHIEKGKVYGFLGPNGAGKSTTMNILTGYIGATGGTVVINGHDILLEPDEARRSIGYLPEIPPLYMDMVVEEYLTFCARLKKISKADCAGEVAKVLEAVAITHVKDRLIKNLSKGYKQRVGLAQALLGYPEIIILDEPTVGLDPKQIIEIRQLIRSLAGEHTVIFSSHILSEVQEVCDEVLIINKGRLVAAGTTADLERRMSSNSL
ncbi:MAG: ABC transporter ATP-binding protein, partial [Oscillospiraceae bacterium]|nr:ABC transporter ATP-binding protein [Oscillospiraceae bacterium]